jgi:hypothetical protein
MNNLPTTGELFALTIFNKIFVGFIHNPIAYNHNYYQRHWIIPHIIDTYQAEAPIKSNKLKKPSNKQSLNNTFSNGISKEYSDKPEHNRSSIACEVLSLYQRLAVAAILL